MRTAENKMATTRIATIATVTATNMTLPPCSGNPALGQLNDEDETVTIDDLDAGTRLQWSGGASPPELSPDPNPPLLSLPSHGLALGPEQRLLAGDDEPPARSE